jgi:uncharacterized linocin/CFP29 family protein
LPLVELRADFAIKLSELRDYDRGRPDVDLATSSTRQRTRSRSPRTPPSALALGREQYTRVVETAEHGGYPLLDHLGKILDGPVVWAPGVEGAVVVSQRGGEFRFESGQDFAIGYDRHDPTPSSSISRRASASW